MLLKFPPFSISLVIIWILLVSFYCSSTTPPILAKVLFYPPDFGNWIIFHSVYVPRFHYPLINWKTFRLFPSPSRCEWSSNQHVQRLWSRISIPLGICQRVVQRAHMADLFIYFFSFLRIIHIGFHNSCSQGSGRPLQVPLFEKGQHCICFTAGI